MLHLLWQLCLSRRWHLVPEDRVVPHQVEDRRADRKDLYRVHDAVALRQLHNSYLSWNGAAAAALLTDPSFRSLLAEAECWVHWRLNVDSLKKDLRHLRWTKWIFASFRESIFSHVRLLTFVVLFICLVCLYFISFLSSFKSRTTCFVLNNFPFVIVRLSFHASICEDIIHCLSQFRSRFR